jgi:CheY-like chemotaxis protein/HPt (histidine-containing phosphotransfer) domain-containing protein
MKRIAVVEDNPDNRLLVQVILEPFYHVVEYESGFAALEGFRAHKPDLVLLDVSLPGLDGPEVLRRIRADDSLRRLPVIALTAHAMAGDRQRFVNAGFDDYVSKPIVEESILLEAIRRQLPSEAPPPSTEMSSTTPTTVPASSGDAPAQSSLVDEAALARLYRLGGQQFALDMLDLFLSYGGEKLAEARLAWKSGSLEALADSVHPIKSSAGNIGATHIQALCAAIEQAVKEQKTSSLEQQLNDLERAFVDVRPHLEREKARLSGKDLK